MELARQAGARAWRQPPIPNSHTPQHSTPFQLQHFAYRHIARATPHPCPLYHLQIEALVLLS